MNHSFDVDIACLHGVDAAILIENFRFWIAKNKANNRHFYDGRWWTYNSVKAFSELFPYWSGPQVRRIIEKMEDAGVLVSGSYNQNPWDKTKWYAFGDGFDLMKKSVPFAEIGKSDTDINTDTTPHTPKGADALFDTFWTAYPVKVGKDAAKRAFTKRKPTAELLGEMLNAIAEQKTSLAWIKEDGQFIPHPATWLNQGRWMDEVPGSIGAAPVQSTRLAGAI